MRKYVTRQRAGTIESGPDFLVEIFRGVVLDECRRIGPDRPGDLSAQVVGDFLGLGARTVDADKAGRIVAAAGQTARTMPALAESHEAVDLRPVGGVEEPEVCRHAGLGQYQGRRRGFLDRQSRPRMAAEVNAVERKSALAAGGRRVDTFHERVPAR